VHKPQRDILELHEALNLGVGEYPRIRRPDLRISLIKEESKELCTAINEGDLVAAIDGMCDLIVVTYGTAVQFGIDLKPFWNEVQRTNLAKVGGPVREDGKVLKPPGWTPPDIEGILHRTYPALWINGRYDIPND
jgi:predicted HAD superfamily Cof-like phosphohydrolase